MKFFHLWRIDLKNYKLQVYLTSKSELEKLQMTIKLLQVKWYFPEASITGLCKTAWWIDSVITVCLVLCTRWIEGTLGSAEVNVILKFLVARIFVSCSLNPSHWDLHVAVSDIHVRTLWLNVNLIEYSLIFCAAFTYSKTTK